jgi:hypothetical protein
MWVNSNFKPFCKMSVQTYQVSITGKNKKERVIELVANGATNAWFIAKELNPGCEIKVLGY